MYLLKIYLNIYILRRVDEDEQIKYAITIIRTCTTLIVWSIPTEVMNFNLPIGNFP